MCLPWEVDCDFVGKWSQLITLTQPLASAGLTTVSAMPSYTEDDTWFTGDTMQLMTNSILNLKSLNPQGGDTNGIHTTPVCWVQNAYIPEVTGIPGNSNFCPLPQGCSMVFSTCGFDPFVIFDAHYVYSAGYLANCFVNGGCQLSTFATLVSGVSAGTTMLGDAAVDGDVILNGPLQVLGGDNDVGFAHVTGMGGGAGVRVLDGGYLKIQQNLFASAQLWGSGLINLIGGNSVLENRVNPPTLWANCLTVTGPLELNGSNTGTVFNDTTGLWTSGVLITSANIDTRRWAK